ncbi:NUDIX domain-containing protein [Xanthobacteraceae bacterium A53D]
MWLLRPLLPFAPLVRRMRHGVTLGVRVAALDGEGRVLLVRHTYTPGWHLPGGGVDVGETPDAAARRELREEANTHLTGPLALHGFFFNPASGGRDYVACYHASGVAFGPLPARSLEIAEVGAFALDGLPPDTTPATRRRLNEIASGTPPDDCW